MIVLFQMLRKKLIWFRIFTPYFHFWLHLPHLRCIVARLLHFVKYMCFDQFYKTKQDFSISRLLVCATNILDSSPHLYINYKLQDTEKTTFLWNFCILYLMQKKKNYQWFYGIMQNIYLNCEWEPGNYVIKV